MIHLQNEGPTICPALIMVMHNGKTNKHGKTVLSGCIRNKIVELCPIMMCSSYMFQRFHNEGEPLLTFTSSGEWFGVKVLKTCNNPTTEWKGSGARMADLAGIGQDQIRRQGRWNNNSMNGAYLTGVPRETMRTSAGFPLAQGHFYLPRAILEPPVELQQKVFPWTDQWLGKVRLGVAETSNSAISFLKILVTFRVTFLQDAVFMGIKYPGHPIFINPLFHDELFRQFSSDLQAAVIENEGNDLVNMHLRTAVPLIAQRLEMMQKVFDAENRIRDEQIKTVIQHLSDISTDRAPVNINVHIPGDIRQPPVVTTDFEAGPSTLVSERPLPVVPSSALVQSESNTTVGYRFAMALTLPIVWRE
ncbi:hypothetical protein INT47_007392 [Mucor saturninus]|uniref:Ndc10 domain-containing protein n=1 Tax=Mucor saturninus TaxID=64648 RepID=A0A8H7QIZ1_9FUNG|nr:hypothetical protein INT47_007392 [Mucor saturninus]